MHPRADGRKVRSRCGQVMHCNKIAPAGSAQSAPGYVRDRCRTCQIDCKVKSTGGLGLPLHWSIHGYRSKGADGNPADAGPGNHLPSKSILAVVVRRAISHRLRH